MYEQTNGAPGLRQTEVRAKMQGPTSTQTIKHWSLCTGTNNADLLRGLVCMSTVWSAHTNGVNNQVRNQTLNAWMYGLDVNVAVHACSEREPQTRVCRKARAFRCLSQSLEPAVVWLYGQQKRYQERTNQPRTHTFSNFEASTFFKVLSRTQEKALKDEVYPKKLVGP